MSGLSVAEMLESLDAAIGETSRWQPGKIVLELTGARVVLGEHGRRMQAGDGSTVFGYTRGQCVRMRDTILAAARVDAGGAR